MARGRMLSQSIAEDFEFNAMSCEAKMLFMMAIPHLDRDGLISGHISILQGKICPLMPDMLSKMQSVTDEWVNANLAITYDSPKGRVLFFTGFSKNNTGMRYEREAPSVYPPPPGWTRSSAGLVENTNGGNPNSDRKETSPQESVPTPDKVRTESVLNPPEVKGKEKEIKTTTAPARETIRTDGDETSSGGSVPPPKKPDGWQSVVNAYESNIGVFTQLSSEMVQAAVVEYGPLLVVDAIKESVRQNVRKWSYVDGVLRRWNANGRDSPKPKEAERKPPQTITIFNQYTNQYEERKVS